MEVNYDNKFTDNFKNLSLNELHNFNNSIPHKNIDIVVGLQYGDEGKGKVVNHLARNNKYDYCIRYNGGANAGHTIYNNGKKIVTHQIPSGLLHGIKSIIADNCYINVDKLLEECRMLKENGYVFENNLFLSDKCHLITDKHLGIDEKDSIIGTTKSGIGPCAIDKYGRNGIRLCDDTNHKEKLLKLGINIVNVPCLIYQYYASNGYFPALLIEGAQGFGLDINHGDYPYVTSSHCIASDCFNLGIPFKKLSNLHINIIGIAKLYETYVGNKNFQPENNEELVKIQTIGKEFGATTGRSRQCNYLNLNKLFESCFINQVNWLVINKCDILCHESLNCYKVLFNENIRVFNSFEAMKKFICEYMDQLPYLDAKNDIDFSFNPNTI